MRWFPSGTLTDDDLALSPWAMIGMGSRIEGFWLSRFIRNGVLTSKVGQTFPLEEMTAAVQHAEVRGQRGKTLLRIGDS